MREQETGCHDTLGRGTRLTKFQRGVRGNIGSPKVKPASHGHDQDVIPETATRLAEQESHHTGRGGGKLFCLILYANMTESGIEGNVHHVQEDQHPSGTESLVDKLKHKVIGDKKQG